jgi:CheY-like chemotaxis protein
VRPGNPSGAGRIGKENDVSATVIPPTAVDPRRAWLQEHESQPEECPICNHSHRNEPRGAARPAEILVVEDEPSIARLIAHNLEQSGYRVSIAADGVQALRALREAPPDLLILDLLLPLQSGWQVLRELRAHRNARLSKLPVVVVSALACERLERQLSALGAEHVLGKPFSVRELLAVARELLSRSPASPEPLALQGELKRR